MNTRIIKIFFIFCLCTGTARAGSIVHFFDSVKNTAYNSKIPLVKNEALLHLARLYADRDLKEACKIANAALNLSIKNKNKLYQAMAYKLIGYTYEIQEIPIDSATFFYHKAMECLKDEKSNELKAAYLLYRVNSVGRSGIQTNDENLRESLRAFELLAHSNQRVLKGEIADRIGLAYWQKGFDTHIPKYHEKATYYWKQAFEIYTSAGRAEDALSMKGKIATSYLSLNQPAKALPLLLENFKVNTLINNTMKLAGTCSNLGDCYVQTGDFKNAEKFYLLAEKYFKKIGFRGGYGWIYIRLINLYEKKNDFKNAFLISKIRIDELSENIDNNRQKEVYKIRNDYEKRLTVQKSELLLKENALKDAILKKDRFTLFFLTISVVILISFIISLFFYYRNQNRINSLKSLFEGQELERQRLGSELHDGIGSMLSAIKASIEDLRLSLQEKGGEEIKKIEKSLHLFDLICEEVRQITHNLVPDTLNKIGLKFSLQQLIYQYNEISKTNITLDFIGYESSGDEMTELHLHRIILELIHNIIKHADADQAVIRLVQHEDYISLVAEDDGKGFSEDTQTGGIGLINIQNRVKLLKGRFQIDSHPDNGTTVIIEFPLNK